MADVLDEVADWLRLQLHAIRPDVIPSAAPGGGPSAGREGPVSSGGTGGMTPGMRLSDTPRSALGYGGHGDPAFIVNAPQQTRAELQELVERTAKSRMRDKLRSRFRFQIPYSPEGHVQDGWRFIAGPWSMLDGSTTAPSAGGSTQVVPLQMPTGTPSPVLLLDRYPGALYMSIYVRTFAWMRLGSAMTGQQELYFTDVGGAVASLGIYDAGVSSNGLQSIGVLCNTPITDPGNAAVGQLNIVNIGIGGTPVGCRYQIGLGYVAMVPDPWFQSQQLVPPTPADVTSAMLAAESSR